MRNNAVGNEPPQTVPGKNTHNAVVLWIVLLIIIGAAGFSFWYSKQLKSKNLATAGQIDAEKIGPKMEPKEIKKLLDKISEHILLPEGEEPTIATIEDASQLIGLQPLFFGSENGDQVLLYSDKAVIYSPGKDKLINVGPIIVQGNNEKIDETQ